MLLCTAYELYLSIMYLDNLYYPATCCSAFAIV